MKQDVEQQIVQMGSGSKAKWMLGAILIAVCLLYLTSFLFVSRQANTASVVSVPAVHGKVMDWVNQLKGVNDSESDISQQDTRFQSKIAPVLYPELEKIEPEFSSNEIKNRMAQFEQTHQQFKKNTQRLRKSDAQLRSSKGALSGLQADFAEIGANQQNQWANRQAMSRTQIDAADLPSQEQAQSLVVQRGNSNISNKAANVIPPKVLAQVQQTTGISADEINQLMNQ